MNTKKMETRLNVNFGAIQGFYWMAYSSMSGFASVFLLSVNFDNTQIGIVLALANIFAVILQPFVATIADSSKKVTLKQLVMLIGFIDLSLAAVLLFIPDVFLVLAVLFILVLTAFYIIQPLISGLIFEFVNRGVSVNFGLTRGVGSVSYAVISYILGIMVERLGPSCLPYVSVIIILLFNVCVIVLTDSRKVAIKQESRQSKKQEHPASSLTFMRENKMFMGYLVGVLFLFAYHNMYNNYMIHIVNRVGGSSTQMGTTIFIAAILELPVMGISTYLLRKFPVQKLMAFSVIFFFIKALAGFFASSMGMIYATQMLQMPSYAVYIPVSVYYVNVIMKESDRVKGQAYTTSAMTGGAVIGSLLGGTCLDLSGVSAMLMACIICSAVGMVLIIGFTRQKGVQKAYEEA